jgi:hypothetical protein
MTSRGWELALLLVAADGTLTAGSGSERARIAAGVSNARTVSSTRCSAGSLPTVLPPPEAAAPAAAWFCGTKTASIRFLCPAQLDGEGVGAAGRPYSPRRVSVVAPTRAPAGGFCGDTRVNSEKPVAAWL